jgi:hypothetical protein
MGPRLLTSSFTESAITAQSKRFKMLQAASICFEIAMYENAIICNEMHKIE